jgi:hypothetical protein
MFTVAFFWIAAKYRGAVYYRYRGILPRRFSANLKK